MLCTFVTSIKQMWIFKLKLLVKLLHNTIPEKDFWYYSTVYNTSQVGGLKNMEEKGGKAVL